MHGQVAFNDMKPCIQYSILLFKNKEAIRSGTPNKHRVKQNGRRIHAMHWKMAFAFNSLCTFPVTLIHISNGSNNRCTENSVGNIANGWNIINVVWSVRDIPVLQRTRPALSSNNIILQLNWWNVFAHQVNWIHWIGDGF